jgi:hypothetical protein
VASGHRSDRGDGALALSVKVALSKGSVDVGVLIVVGVPGGGLVGVHGVAVVAVGELADAADGRGVGMGAAGCWRGLAARLASGGRCRAAGGSCRAAVGGGMGLGLGRLGGGEDKQDFVDRHSGLQPCCKRFLRLQAASGWSSSPQLRWAPRGGSMTRTPARGTATGSCQRVQLGTPFIRALVAKKRAAHCSRDSVAIPRSR